MFSPIHQNIQSSFTSLRNSSAQSTPTNHFRTNSTNRPLPMTIQTPLECMRVPSQKKLSLTSQGQPSKTQQSIPDE